MTSLNNEGERQRGIYWPRIVAMLFVQILILLALGAVVVRYLQWSSDANQAEFMSAPSHRHLIRIVPANFQL